MELWEEALELSEEIGDIEGKATTIAQMAWLLGKQGECGVSEEFSGPGQYLAQAILLQCM